MKRVVVTGIGVVVPGGVGAEEFWRGSVAGISRLRHEPLMERMGLKSRAVAAIDGWRLADHHSAADTAELSRLSRFVQLSVTAGAMAGRDARLEAGGFAPERAGTVMSSAIGGTPEFQRAYEKQSDHGAVALRPFEDGEPFYDSVFLNFPPSWLARRFGLRGPSSTLTTGCTAGIDSLGLAFEQIRQGELDIVLAGGGEAPLSGLAYATLDVIGSLSTADVPPEQASRPFDAKRGGFVLGEGAAALVLEEYEHAVARGATCYAEVTGFASSNNAFHMSDLAEDGMSMAVVMEGALRDAGLPPEAIDYVNAHGSSTPQNDVFETQALKKVLGERHAARTPVSSTKSMIGHSLASASLVGTIAAIGALRYQVVPPTINYEFPDPRCDLDYVPNQARAHEVATVMVTASGFGGIHSCAVLRRVGEPVRDWWPGVRAEAGRPGRAADDGDGAGSRAGSGAGSGFEADRGAGSGSGTVSGSGPGTESGVGSGSGSGGVSGFDAGSESGFGACSDPDPGSESGAGFGPGARSGSGPGSDSGAGLESGSGAGSDSSPGFDPGTGSVSGAGFESGAGSAAGAGAAPVSVSLSGPGGRALVSGPVDAFGQVLFLHGFGGCADHWEPLMRLIGPRARAVAVDLPGHGGNRLPADADQARTRRFLTEVLGELFPRGPVTVVGHSLGGLLALDLAAAHPERVGRVAVVGSAARVRLFPRLLGQLAAGVIDDSFLAAAVRDEGTAQAERARHLVVDGFRRLRYPARCGGVWGLEDAEVPVEGIAVPSLVVIAGGDRVVSPRKSRALAARLPDSRTVVLPETDHYVHLERPGEVWRALRDFVTARPHEPLEAPRAAAH